MKRPKYEILLKAFLVGQQVKIGDYIYGMSDDRDIVIVDQNNTERGFSIDLKFKEFMDMADKLSEDQIFELAANNGLNEIMEDKARKREILKNNNDE
jgi:hypothetical protein